MPELPTHNATVNLTSPADGIPATPPVTTRQQVLPFDQLTWENFERLCHRVACLEAHVEHAERYGLQGEAQEGLDIYARLSNGRYHCLQAKKHRRFAAAQIASAVDLFIAGRWAVLAATFTIAVQASLRSTTVQNEIERQAERLAALGVTFFALDGESLTIRLREHPPLIDDFFGRAWVSALLGEAAAAALKNRLDGGEFARTRKQLAAVYDSNFHFVDSGSFGSIGDVEARSDLTLLERYIKPDVLVSEKSRALVLPEPAMADDQTLKPSGEVPRTSKDRGIRSDAVANSRTVRIPFAEWSKDLQRLVVLGEAGSGKSTLLRVIALDLLHKQSHFPELALSWGDHLPIYIPFARWSAHTAHERGIVGIKEIVRRSLQHFLTESLVNLIERAIDDRRVLLLIDGLDEWSNEQAARTTLAALVTSVEAHGIPTVVSGRPRGLDRIGALPTSWRRAKIAPLSEAQQAEIASRWFLRFSAASSDGAEVSAGSLRTKRFMGELARDTNLGFLASTPLLLVGLVTLALRGQILPRTRDEVYNQLVRVLLEVHPNSRATASGDTEPRFQHATEYQRRAAVARLAFEVRKASGGAGIEMSAARETLRSYLASPMGFELDSATAASAAEEILSVNSETQGLVVEKAPGELGFVHASFEEYLGAEHVSGWPFDEIEVFVRSHAGQSRWRNVVANLLSRIPRRDEFDRLVALVEEADLDEVSQINKHALLGDIAFGVSIRSASTAKRLARDVMQQVENHDWMPARREALSSVLTGLSDSTLRGDVESRVADWLPARVFWRNSLIEELGNWTPSEDLLKTLFRALHDENRTVQKSAARAYARAFATSDSARQTLVASLSTSRDVHASVAMLESLALGWPADSQSVALFEEAWSSRHRELRLIGAFGLLAQGAGAPEMRDVALEAQDFWHADSHEYRGTAAWMLGRYWPNEPDLVKGAIARLSGGGPTPWDYDAAGSYLLACDISNSDVRRWLLNEFKRDHPFIFDMHSRNVWRRVAQFAENDAEIRKAAIAHWQNPDHRLVGLHNLLGYVELRADPEIAAVLREVLFESEGSFSRYWALRAMLNGWGRDHPEVSASIDALIDAPEDQLEDLVSMVPEIYRSQSSARARLLSMSERPKIRFDMLVEGFARNGSDGTDDEVVQRILAHRRHGGIFDAYPAMFRSFSAHPCVREVAEQCLQAQDPPASAIAFGFRNDPLLADSLFAGATPIPTELRTQIVEFASTGASGTVLDTIVELAMHECDPELRVRMSVLRHSALSVEEHQTAIEDLLKKAVSVGHNYEEVRGAALAGLLAAGAVDCLADVKENNKPVSLFTGNLLHEMPSLDRQICKHFAELEAAFGPDLSSRFHRTTQRGLAEILCAAPSASPAAKTAFLSLVERGELPKTIQALSALASERPRSDVLLQHCWKMLEQNDHNNSTAAINAEVGEVLRENFPDESDVLNRLIGLYRRGQDAGAAIALAVYAPLATEFDSRPMRDRRYHFADWAVAVRIAAVRHRGDAFIELLERMVTREYVTQFDAQDCINRAVYERLQRDPELIELFNKRLSIEIDGSVSGTFARYLASAGMLDENARAMGLNLLKELSKRQQLVVTGYDAVAGRQRALRATLLDAVTAGLD